jgi:tetraacyldisaccharide 4'-kinase
MKRPWLVPLVPLYRLVLALSERKAVRRLQWPVVSIGNLSTGGAGKTPLTIALTKALVARGLHVDVLSRGYGRDGADRNTASEVQSEGSPERFGDEPLEIARATGVPVYVAVERYEAGWLAEVVAEERADETQTGTPHGLHLLDDGFQHRQLHRDIDILLLSRDDWRDSLLPAGNLREPLHGAAKADVIALPGNEPDFETELRGWLNKRGWQGPIWRLNRRMEVPALEGPAVAFCGIARPEQFFTGLENAGVRLAARIAFPDHHPYTPAAIARIKAALQSSAAATLLTTEKDAVRLGPLAAGLPLRAVPLRTEIENESGAIDWLLARLNKASGQAR